LKDSLEGFQVATFDPSALDTGHSTPPIESLIATTVSTATVACGLGDPARQGRTFARSCAFRTVLTPPLARKTAQGHSTTSNHTITDDPLARWAGMALT
jgi:hypothetical protein